MANYGKTSRHFIVPYKQHLEDNKQGISIKGVSSSIRDRIKYTGHSASIDSFCILGKVSNKLDLFIHKSFLNLGIAYSIGITPT